MKLIKIIPIFAIALFFLTPAYALQQTVGKITMYVELGEGNSSSYGLINDKNETLIAKLRTEGDISNFVEMPKTLELPPKKFVSVYVNASIPKDYDFSKGRNITGYVYALLEGQPGQVQINIQARKTVEIIVLGGKENTLPKIKVESLPISGFFALVSNPIFSFAIGLVLALFIMYFFFQRKNVNKYKWR